MIMSKRYDSYFKYDQILFVLQKKKHILINIEFYIDTQFVWGVLQIFKNHKKICFLFLSAWLPQPISRDNLYFSKA